MLSQVSSWDELYGLFLVTLSSAWPVFAVFLAIGLFGLLLRRILRIWVVLLVVGLSSFDVAPVAAQSWVDIYPYGCTSGNVTWTSGYTLVEVMSDAYDDPRVYFGSGGWVSCEYTIGASPGVQFDVPATFPAWSNKYILNHDRVIVWSTSSPFQASVWVDVAGPTIRIDIVADSGNVSGFRVRMDSQYLATPTPTPTLTPTPSPTVTPTYIPPTPTPAPCVPGMVGQYQRLAGSLRVLDSPGNVYTLRYSPSYSSGVIRYVVRDYRGSVNYWLSDDGTGLDEWWSSWGYDGVRVWYRAYSGVTLPAVFSVTLSMDTPFTDKSFDLSVWQQGYFSCPATPAPTKTLAPLVSTAAPSYPTGVVEYRVTPQATACLPDLPALSLSGGTPEAGVSSYRVCVAPQRVDSLRVGNYDLLPTFNYLLIAGIVLGLVTLFTRLRS